MEKRRIFFVSLLALVLVFAIVHLTLRFAVYGTGISGLMEKGVSGFSIADFNVEGQIKGLYPDEPIWSKIGIGVEWGLIVGILFFMFVSGRYRAVRELKELHREKIGKRTGMMTDLDSFYEILKEKKSLKLSSVCKLFGVEKEIVLSWCKTLETGKLANLSYPFFGSPEISLVEKAGVINEK